MAWHPRGVPLHFYLSRAVARFFFPHSPTQKKGESGDTPHPAKGRLPLGTPLISACLCRYGVFFIAWAHTTFDVAKRKLQPTNRIGLDEPHAQQKEYNGHHDAEHAVDNPKLECMA